VGVISDEDAPKTQILPSVSSAADVAISFSTPPNRKFQSGTPSEE
jgi:hypothetical protein